MVFSLEKRKNNMMITGENCLKYNQNQGIAA